ncbi:MAG: hypothetical protein F4206_06820 [Gammaproteobacteria bacterium]|nr:hypothetical protein [Gammaproteobacteria bacterium]MYG66423.1 hypothetical protein [Gammaproteobacteria bacterium]
MTTYLTGHQKHTFNSPNTVQASARRLIRRSRSWITSALPGRASPSPGWKAMHGRFHGSCLENRHQSHAEYHILAIVRPKPLVLSEFVSISTGTVIAKPPIYIGLFEIFTFSKEVTGIGLPAH